MDLPLRIEDVGHDDEVYSFDSSFLFIVFNFVQTKESSDQSLRVIDHMSIILFENHLQPGEFIMTDGFQHIFWVRCVVEEGATLAGGALFFQSVDITCYHWAYNVLWSDAF